MATNFIQHVDAPEDSSPCSPKGQLSPQRLYSRVADIAAMLAAIFCVLPIIAAAFTQVVDGDEGFYTMAAKLVWEGRIPYIDFMYPQTPLYPYFLSYWFALFGVSWISARALSAVATLLLAFVLYDHVRKLHGRCFGILAVLLLAFNSLACVWFAVAKAYSVSALLLFVGYVAMMRSLRRSSWRLAICAGILVSLSGGCRLLCLGALPAFFWCFWKRGNRRLLVRFAQGLALGFLPTLLILFRDVNAFFFNNVAYHLLRSNHGLLSGWGKKLEVLGQLFGISGEAWLSGLQALLVAGMISAAWWWNRRKGRSMHPAIMIAALLFIVHLLPSPIFTQYFCVIVPFAIVGIVAFVAELLERAQVTGSWQRSWASTLAGALALGLYFLLPPFAIKPTASLEQVDTIATLVRGNSQAEDAVLSFWPGFLLETNARPVSGFENHFALRISARLDAEEEERFKIGSYAAAKQSIVSGQPTLVVVPIMQLAKGIEGKSLGEWLTSSGYGGLRSVGDFRIFKKDYQPSAIEF